jgi:hypothetical protein
MMTRTSIGLALWGLLLTGCTNAPDALRLQVSPHEASFRQGEAVCLDVKLSAVRDAVCLSRSHFFVVELRQIDGRAAFKSPEQRFYCGTAMMGILPLLPLLYPAALLDVGDLMGRFVVLRQGCDHEQHLLLILRDDQLATFVVGDLSRWDAGTTMRQLPAGGYHVRLRLVNEHAGLPCPLFWKPYDGPVTAETEITIVRSDISTTRTE